MIEIIFEVVFWLLIAGILFHTLIYAPIFGGKMEEENMADKDGKRKKEKMMLMILRNLSARSLPLSFSLDELAKADLIFAGTKEEKERG